MFNIFTKSLKTGRVTIPEPLTDKEAPEGFRGLPQADPGLCRKCGRCGEVCPTGTITVSDFWQIAPESCIFCGQCVDGCPAGALSQAREYQLAKCLRDRVHKMLGRSAHIRHVDAGSCNGCDWEMNALLNPVYDLQRFGLDFVASPRHADILMVTGPVTKHLEAALRRTYAAAPDPKVVIAVGTCACSGGICQGSYAVEGPVDRIVPVDTFIPGCPPRPQALIHGLLAALGRLA